MAQASGGPKRKKPSLSVSEPVIPDKLYFRIGEVARLLSLPPYVLRFWESEFPQLHPNKGGTGQRLYRRRDVEMAMRIKRLLYDEGYTIPGARQYLKVEARHMKEPELPFRAPVTDAEMKALQLKRVHEELREIASLLARPLPGSRRVQLPRPDRKGLHLTVRKPQDHAASGASLFPESDAVPEGVPLLESVDDPPKE